MTAIRNRPRRSLGRWERRYLRRLQTLLVVLRGPERRRVLRLARTNLEERPAAPSWDRLTLELGEPDRYARQLIDEEHLLPQPALWRRATARFRSPSQLLATVVLVVALAAGAVAYRDWYTHRPELAIEVCHRPTSEAVPIIETRAMSSEEYTAPFVEGGDVRFAVCVRTSETIDVLDVRFPFLFDRSNVELESVTTQAIFDAEAPQPFAPFTAGGWGDREHTELAVIFDSRFVTCEVLRSRGINSRPANYVELTYRFHGRTHLALLEVAGTLIHLGEPMGQPCRVDAVSPHAD